MKKKALVFLAEGFEEIEAITPIDVLRRADVDVQIVSISDDLHVVGAHNIIVKADVLFENADFAAADLLILPGGGLGTKNLNAHADLKWKLVEFAEDDKLIGAICAAPSILGGLGILKGRCATCYPGFENTLKGTYISDHRIERDDNIITGRGAGCALDFGLALVEALLTRSEACELADKMIYSYYSIH